MKRFFTLVFALTLFCARLSAQTAAYRTDRNIAYRDAAGDGYADSLCRLDICYPTDAKSRRLCATKVSPSWAWITASFRA